MWMLPLYLHVNQKSDYDDDIQNDRSKISVDPDQMLQNAPYDQYLYCLPLIQQFLDKSTMNTFKS